MDTNESQMLDIGRWHCELEAQPVGALFQPIATCRLSRGESVRLPQDTEPYATRAEALRHAQQQAMRYVRDH
jgi:hypothetical protein